MNIPQTTVCIHVQPLTIPADWQMKLISFKLLPLFK